MNIWKILRFIPPERSYFYRAKPSVNMIFFSWELIFIFPSPPCSKCILFAGPNLRHLSALTPCWSFVTLSTIPLSTRQRYCKTLLTRSWQSYFAYFKSNGRSVKLLTTMKVWFDKKLVRDRFLPMLFIWHHVVRCISM